MAIKKKKERLEKTVIDLTGPDGNAFVLLGIASQLGKKLGFDQEQRDKIRTDMTSGDYENLIQVFDENFGDYVDLER
jgi:ABC-type glycerol-3-phosphate transport system substrate-binding protein